MSANATSILMCCDNFETLYLQPALESAGATIISSTGCMDELRSFLDSTDALKAAVLSSNLVGDTCWDLARELQRRNIAHIVLIDSVGHDDQVMEQKTAVLRRPYGSYQIVDWFEQVQVGRS